MAEHDVSALERHFGYARSLAGQIGRRLPSHVDREDLEAAALQGLVEAWNRFDPRRGASFKTFAFHRVRGAVFDWLRRSTWLSPQDWRELTRMESLDELARVEECSPGELRADDLLQRTRSAVRRIAVTMLLSDLAGPGAEGSQTPTGVEHEEPWGRAADAELGSLLRAAVGDLPARQRRIVELRFFEHRSVTEIAALLGIHKSNVTRSCQVALASLQSRLAPLVISA